MNVLEKSIIVAAHPDDENLWFSSVLSKVDSIILCFLPVASSPVWTEGRRKSLADYPLENITCLELEESEVFWGADWSHPVKTEYGLEITDNVLPDTLYRKNYYSLVPEYTNDGAHLNELGRKIVAEGLLNLLASIK